MEIVPLLIFFPPPEESLSRTRGRRGRPGCPSPAPRPRPRGPRVKGDFKRGSPEPGVAICRSLSHVAGGVRNGVSRGSFSAGFSRPSSEKASEGVSREHRLCGAPARGPLPRSGLGPRPRPVGKAESLRGHVIHLSVCSREARAGEAASPPGSSPGSGPERAVLGVQGGWLSLLCRTPTSSVRPKHVTLAALGRGGGSEGVWPHPRARLLRNYCTPTVLPAVLWELRT